MIIFIGISGCSDKQNEKKELVRSIRAEKVSQFCVKTKLFSGVVKENREVKLAFQVPGSLVGLKVQEGQYVRKGELIAELDPRDYRVRLESASANYQQAKVQADRYAALYEKRSTSKSVYDQTQAAFKLAKAQKEGAENALSDTKIYAPFDGYVQTKYAENHEKIGVGQPIITLLDLNKMEVVVSLSESDYLLSKRFEGFTCLFESLGGLQISADAIDIDKKPEDGQFYKMRLQPKGSGCEQLVPGMVARVTIHIKANVSERVFSVPVEAIFGKNGESYVWVYDSTSNKVVCRSIEVGDLNSTGRIEVLKGVSEGEWIVTAGVHSLAEGQRVRLLDAMTKSNVGGQL